MQFNNWYRELPHMRIEAFTTYMPVGMSFCVEKPQRQTFGHRFVPDHKKSLRLKGVLTKYKIDPQQLEENFLAKHLPRALISKYGSKKVLQKMQPRTLISNLRVLDSQKQYFLKIYQVKYTIILSPQGI